jgi:hypothetical protein
VLEGHYVGVLRTPGGTRSADALLTTDGALRIYFSRGNDSGGALPARIAPQSAQLVAVLEMRGSSANGGGMVIGQGCSDASVNQFCVGASPGEVSVQLSGGGLVGEIRVTTSVGVETWNLETIRWTDSSLPPATLANVAGQYVERWAEFARFGDTVVTVDDAGRIFFQSPDTGCVGNGALTPLAHSNVVAYFVRLTIENCAANYSHLNSDFEGLATTSPSSVWNYDSNLLAWLSSPADGTSPVAMTLASSPIY